MSALTTTDNIARIANAFDNTKLTAASVQDTDDALYTFLNDFAVEYVQNYTGSFGFMLNMKKQVQWGLNDAQVAGVINCAIGDYRYAAKRAAVNEAQAIVTEAAQPTQRTYDHSTQVVTDGYYTVQGNTSHRTIRLTTVKDSDGVKQWLAYLSGSDNVGDYTTVGFVHGNEVTLFAKNQGKFADIFAAARYVVKNVDRLGEFGKNYATRSGNCFRCNRLLTTPESVARGLGPTCASK